MFYRFSLVILLLPLWLTACASKPENDKGSHNIFTTDIRSDGSKRFVFAIVYQVEKREGGRDEGKRSGNKGDGSGRKGKGPRDEQQASSAHKTERRLSDDSRETVVTLLEEKIAKTAYCRNGYIELDYSQMPDKVEIVGECVESATDEDKQRWK